MHENEWLNWHVNGTWLFNQGLPLLLSPWERGFADGMISTYGRNIKGSYKVIESSRPQQKYWHFFKPESYVVEDKQRLAKDYEWNLHVLDVFSGHWRNVKRPLCMIMSDEQLSPPILVRVFFWTLLPFLGNAFIQNFANLQFQNGAWWNVLVWR